MSAIAAANAAAAASALPGVTVTAAPNPALDVKQVQVRFVSRVDQATTTKTDEPSATAAAAATASGMGGITHATIDQLTYTVPVQLARDGLSELVNTLLSQEDAPHVYEFLVDGEFLISDIRKYLIKKQSAGEQVLVLEYVEAMQSSLSSSHPHPDWISAVDGSHPTNLLTACYDSVVRIYDDKQIDAPIATAIGHTGSVKAVKYLYGNAAAAQPPTRFVSGGKDKSVRVWSHARNESKYCKEIAVGTAHTDSVECIAVLPTADSSRFASGGWDKQIHIWDSNSGAVKGGAAAAAANAKSEDGDGDDEPASEKKRKTTAADGKSTGAVSGENSVRQLTPLLTLGSVAVPPTAAGEAATVAGSAHNQAVSALCWPAPPALYSGSWDHTIKLWDTNTGTNVSNWVGSTVVTGMSFSLHANVLATSHTDKLIRMWDPRQPTSTATASDSAAATPTASMKAAYRGHTGWVSAVVFHPSPAQPHLFASSGYDSTLRLWDLRSTRVPRQTIVIPPAATAAPLPRTNALIVAPQKMLCVDWHSTDRLLCGGSTGELHSYAMATSTKLSTASGSAAPTNAAAAKK